MMLLSMLIIGFTSCEDLIGGGNKLPADMVMENTEFSLPAKGGKVELKFKPLSAWTALSEDAWVKISPESGEASKEEVVVTITAGKNEGEKRTASVVLSFETNDITITIEQDAAEAVIPEDPEDPKDPDDPENPDDPNTPDPDDPENPDDPNTPDPDDPENPDDPNTPDPDDPNTPDPDDPENPEDPDTPVVPEDPTGGTEDVDKGEDVGFTK